MRDSFFFSLLDAARKDESIVVLSGDHGAFALDQFASELPNQYFNVGIAEQNMVSVAAGLASVGLLPFVYGIAPFLSIRALEQLTLDIAANDFPVNIVSVGAGFTYSTDGPTHHGLQDLAAASSIPGMTVLNSSDPDNTSQFVRHALWERKPHYIRIEKEKLENLPRSVTIEQAMESGFSAIESREPAHVALVTTGVMSHLGLNVVYELRDSHSIPIDLFDIHQISPWPGRLVAALRNYSSIYVIEDSYSSVIAREIALHGHLDGSALPVRAVFDAGKQFYFHGDNRDAMHKSAGLSLERIVDSISRLEAVGTRTGAEH